MTPPKHEPPDPELWGRVVEIAKSLRNGPNGVLAVPPDSDLRNPVWLVTIESNALSTIVCGLGPTWNDAARALIAEWEGRKG